MRGCVSAGMASVLVNLGLVDTIDEVCLMCHICYSLCYLMVTCSPSYTVSCNFLPVLINVMYLAQIFMI